ncbi:MAG: glutamyl-tRNA reductase [Opitutales bacterium]|nr:glutamyl-tRNA reductase [Opitutales bacterium]
MPAADGPQLVVIGCNHHHTPLAIREQIALSPEGVEALRKRLIEDGSFEESLILNTCNRVEVYAISQSPQAARHIYKHLSEVNQFPESSFREHAYEYFQEQAIEHLFQVAAGLNSQIVGETEILGQVKAAYAEAIDTESIGPLLHRVFQKAFQASKWVRTHTGIGVGQVSLGNVAVELATRIFGRLTVARTLVIGSGEVGRDVAKAFRSRGVACVSIASRTADRAEGLARAVDGLIIPFKNWKSHLPYVDICIFATSAPGAILNPEEMRAAMKQRPSRPVFLIDLAVPRDVEPTVNDLSSVFLYNYDDLAGIANENLRNRATEMANCKNALQSRSHHLWAQMAERYS